MAKISTKINKKIKSKKAKITKTASKQKSRLVSRLFKKEGIPIVDSETLILETQKRIWAALKKGYEYHGSRDESEKFLRANVFSRIDMMVIYVDLVGSTTMTLELPEERLAIIISSFAQEMAAVIRRYNGFVLKFAGDAIIGYFIAEEDSLRAADNVVNCAKSMISVIDKGINPILNQYDYPDLMVKIGIDFGKNIVVRYGADAKRSHVDLMGPAMNIASKIQAMAKPNQILVGDDVYTRLHPSTQKHFKEIIWQNNEWKYRSRVTGEIYKVFEFAN